jgi:uncharacterized membrane protein YecN with MAPEG domain
MVSLGSGGHEDLEGAIQAQANFSEYVPSGSYYLPARSLMEAHGGWILFKELSLLLAA